MTAVQERWFKKLSGEYNGPAGEWDRFVTLALRFGWSEQQIWQSSPDFIGELIARLNAGAAYGEARKRPSEKEKKEQRRASFLAWARGKNAAAVRKMTH